MSQSLTLELSEQVFVAIQRQAQVIGIFSRYPARETVFTGFQATFG
ncbi:hypothetical protein AB3R30_06685 [Leptolyngbyaceae cyanobacterium UHCC 1019]